MIQKLLILITMLMLITACGNTAAPTMEHKADANHDGIEIMDYAARAAGPNGAVYMHLINHTATDDALMSASSDVAEFVEIHQTVIDDNDVMKMSQIEKIDLPAGGEVMLQTGGMHVMLINLQRELKEGDTFDITLNFEQAAPQTLTVAVTSMDGMMNHK